MFNRQYQLSYHRKLIVPGVFGNMLEVYDFVLYGYFAPVLAKLFFPSTDKFLSLFMTFGVFAMGFLMRPLGAILFGHFGDRIGRKKALSASIMLMAMPTTLMGLLPTYEQVGVLAGVLLMICRLFQGLAMGGEFSGSIIYVTEHAPIGRRGFYGSWAMFGTFAGMLMGSAVSAIAGNLFDFDMFNMWGWRVPFLMGFLLGIIGLYLRLRMPETPSFLSVQSEQKIVRSPLCYALSSAFIPMLTVMGLNFLPAVGIYLLFVYLPSYIATFLKMPLQTALMINTFSMIGMIMIIPIVGFLSDKVGRKPILTLAALSFIVFSYPLFLLLSRGDFISVLLVQLAFAALVGFIFAAIPATLIELMQANIRYTAISLPYNLSSALFGGTAPLITTYLIEKTNQLAPAYYLIFAGVVTLFTVRTLKRMSDRELLADITE